MADQYPRPGFSIPGEDLRLGACRVCGRIFVGRVQQRCCLRPECKAEMQRRRAARANVRRKAKGRNR